QPQDRLRVPDVQPAPARAGRGAGAASAALRRGEGQAAEGGGRPGGGGAGPATGPQALGDERRPAAASGDRPGAGDGPGADLSGRADRESGYPEQRGDPGAVPGAESGAG